MSIKSWIAKKVFAHEINRAAEAAGSPPQPPTSPTKPASMPNDGKTTVFSFIFAALQVANIDPVKLFHGDVQQIIYLLSAIFAGLWGWYTNKGRIAVTVTPTPQLEEAISTRAADKAVEKISEATAQLPPTQ